jgi:amidohydrolase
MSVSTSEILEYCRAEFDDVVNIRRDVHMHPEIGFDVHRTAGIAAAELEKLGLKVTQGVGQSGVVGDLDVPGAVGRVAFRADMDALPMQETLDCDYRSRIEGKAHTCGHDVHTATLIGAARTISALRSRLTRNVRFIFQPNEENIPGGAPAMIADGALEGVDEIYGLHVWPPIEVGQYAFCSDVAFSRGDRFEIEIVGRGGHGAVPQLTVDPVVAACHFVTMVQTIVARNIDPLDSAVISVTQIQAGTAFNIIPDRVNISGTVRTFRDEVRQTIREKMACFLSGIDTAYGSTHKLDYRDTFPATYNHPQCLEKALTSARSLADDQDNVIYPYPPDVGSEDFSYYSQKIPACYLFLGSGNHARGIVSVGHNSDFDVDEACMLHGMAWFVQLALTI